MPSDLRLDPVGLEAAAARAAALADELDLLARRAGETLGLEDLPEALGIARAALDSAAAILRGTSAGLDTADRAASRGFRGLDR